MIFKYWIGPRSGRVVKTRVAGFELEVLPGVFHPRYFGTSAMLANFVSALPIQGLSFLDLGCGSGVVALAAACVGAQVTAVDVNPEAVNCTQANVARNELTVDARVSDLFSNLNDAAFDVIAWNPPFLPGTPASASEAAFYGGRDFEIIRRFAAGLRERLKPNGVVYLILSSAVRIEDVESIFQENGFTVSRASSKRWGLGETMVILCVQ